MASPHLFAEQMEKKISVGISVIQTRLLGEQAVSTFQLFVEIFCEQMLLVNEHSSVN